MSTQYHTEQNHSSKVISTVFGLEIHARTTPTHPEGWIQDREFAGKWRTAIEPSPLHFQKVTIFKLIFIHLVHSDWPQRYTIYLKKANPTFKKSTSNPIM